jgi:hypothetical protein
MGPSPLVYMGSLWRDFPRKARSSARRESGPESGLDSVPAGRAGLRAGGAPRYVGTSQGACSIRRQV